MTGPLTGANPKQVLVDDIERAMDAIADYFEGERATGWDSSMCSKCPHLTAWANQGLLKEEFDAVCAVLTNGKLTPDDCRWFAQQNSAAQDSSSPSTDRGPVAASKPRPALADPNEWVIHAYCKLGFVRDSMTPEAVEIVQNFLGPLPSSPPQERAIGEARSDGPAAGEAYKQERPFWCPHQDCAFKRRALDSMCCGNLPHPVEHDGDFNDHRFCLNGASNDGGVFDLQVNDSDLWWFRWLFDALDGKNTANRSSPPQDKQGAAHPDNTPTPLTDAEDDRGDGLVRADFARSLERHVQAMAEALHLLHDNIDEYQRINNLGGHDNQDMRMARAALAAYREFVAKCKEGK